MCIVDLEPVLGSGGMCFVFLGSGKGVLVAALHYKSFQLTTMMNCH
jgi:hypothetical protein